MTNDKNILSKEAIEILKTNDRYKGFTLLKDPQSFIELFEGQDIPCVQIHTAQVYNNGDKKGIVGFCGAFKWEDNKIISLDGDSYTIGMTVFGYEWFNDDSGRCLDILVGDNW